MVNGFTFDLYALAFAAFVALVALGVMWLRTRPPREHTINDDFARFRAWGNRRFP